MHRCLVVSADAIIAIVLVCGCSSARKPSAEELAAEATITPVSATKLPAPKLIHGKATVAHAAADAEIPFTLELPPGWTWADGQAEKIIGPPLTVLMTLTARELPDDEKAEQSAAAARQRLLELGDERKSEDFAAGEKMV